MDPATDVNLFYVGVFNNNNNNNNGCFKDTYDDLVYIYWHLMNSFVGDFILDSNILLSVFKENINKIIW